MIRSYTMRLRVTRKQDAALTALLFELCELYNAALAERREAWKLCRKSIGYYEQQAELTQLRGMDAESASFPVAIQRDPLRRVQRAFDGFFLSQLRSHHDPNRALLYLSELRREHGMRLVKGRSRCSAASPERGTVDAARNDI